VTLQTEARELLLRAWDLHLEFPAQLKLLSEVPESVLLEEPELGFLLAQAQFYGGKWNEALSLVGLVERPLLEAGPERISRRRTNLEAMIRLSLGDAFTAESLLLTVLEVSTAVGDTQLTAFARSNLGVISDIKCRWDEALVHYQHALAAYQKIGHEYGVGQVHHNTAMTYRQLGFYRSSATHFEYAQEYFSSSGVQVEIAGCDNERALLLSALGDRRLADVTARRALHRFSTIQHEPGIGDAHRVLGIIASRAGQDGKAHAYLTTALEYTRRGGDRLTEAETLEEMAVLQRGRGDLEAAGAAQKRAAEIYQSYGALERIQRMRERLAET
jgi:tetratricopeptide (TPR) repeat protein